MTDGKESKRQLRQIVLTCTVALGATYRLAVAHDPDCPCCWITTHLALVALAGTLPVKLLLPSRSSRRLPTFNPLTSPSSAILLPTSRDDRLDGKAGRPPVP